MCVEDAHSHMKDIVLCYLDFKSAFPSKDHPQLVRVLELLGIPQYFTHLVSNLYNEASTENVRPYGQPPPRWELEGEPFKGIPYLNY